MAMRYFDGIVLDGRYETEIDDARFIGAEKLRRVEQPLKVAHGFGEEIAPSIV